MKSRGENVMQRGIFHVVSGFPRHIMLYSGNFDCFSYSVEAKKGEKVKKKIVFL